MKRISLLLIVLSGLVSLNFIKPVEAQSQIMLSMGLKSGYAFGIMAEDVAAEKITQKGVMTYAKLSFSMFAHSIVGFNIDILIGNDYKTQFDYGVSVGGDFIIPITEIGDGLMITIQASGFFQVYIRAAVDVVISYYMRGGPELKRYFYVGLGATVIEASKEYGPNWGKLFLDIGFGFVIY